MADISEDTKADSGTGNIANVGKYHYLIKETGNP